MKESILNSICNYLHSFENSTIINKEIINLSNKIENFCFKCNEEIEISSPIQRELISSYNKSKDINSSDILKECGEEITNFKESISSNDIDYNPSAYLDHDILNKYLHLSDYLKNSCDNKKAIIYLNNIINSKHLTNSHIISKSAIDKELLSSILNNTSNVTKDDAIKLCIGLNLNYDESIDFLLRFGYTLNILNKRDCIIRYGIDNNLAVDEIDYILEELNEQILIAKRL